MRRPLNWIVVSISLLVLFANRMVADTVPPASVPMAASASPGLFAYVQEDGTQLYLPASESPPRPPLSFEFENVHAVSGFDDPGDPKAAVYTWTSPLVITESPEFQ
jgi:hypothetical protein